MSASDSDGRLAARARALAHPVRIAILRALAAEGGCCCGDIVDRLPLAQSTVSQHLKVLREAGLIRGRIERPRCCYRLDEGALAELAGDFAALFAALSGETVRDPLAGERSRAMETA